MTKKTMSESKPFLKLGDGFSILRTEGNRFNLNYPVFKNGEECREYVSFNTFDEALNHYMEMKNV